LWQQPRTPAAADRRETSASRNCTRGVSASLKVLEMKRVYGCNFMRMIQKGFTVVKLGLEYLPTTVAFAPRCAACRAIALPMPLVPPTTTIDLPVRDIA
jgi:hypothetical protein